MGLINTSSLFESFGLSQCTMLLATLACGSGLGKGLRGSGSFFLFYCTEVRCCSDEAGRPGDAPAGSMEHDQGSRGWERGWHPGGLFASAGMVEEVGLPLSGALEQLQTSP